MSLAVRISALVQAIGADIKSLMIAQGSLAALGTEAKTSLVAAINELQAEIGAASGGAVIDDAAGAGETGKTWSASKLVTALAAVKSDILGGVDPAWDTLQEIVARLGDSDDAVGGLLTAVGNRLSFADVQTLTTEQKAQACQNLGLGDPEADLVAVYTAAKA